MRSSRGFVFASLLHSRWFAASLWVLAAATEAWSVRDEKAARELAAAHRRLDHFSGALGRWKTAHATGHRPAMPAEVIRLAAELRAPAEPEIDAQMARIETLVQWISTLRSAAAPVPHGELVRASQRLDAEVRHGGARMAEMTRANQTTARRAQWAALSLAAAGCAAAILERRRRVPALAHS